MFMCRCTVQYMCSTPLCLTCVGKDRRGVAGCGQALSDTDRKHPTRGEGHSNKVRLS